MIMPMIEDTREFKEPRPERVGWCEVCEKAIYQGDKVLKDNNNRYNQAAYTCAECLEKASKETVIEWLNGSIEEAV